MKKETKTAKTAKTAKTVKTVKAKAPALKPRVEDRGELLSKIWGTRKVTRLNRIIKDDYCGPLTVREFVAIVLADKTNFPRGLDTTLTIGDFEGNFTSQVLSVTTSGSMSDCVCLTGDPHEHFQMHR